MTKQHYIFGSYLTISVVLITLVTQVTEVAKAFNATTQQDKFNYMSMLVTILFVLGYYLYRKLYLPESFQLATVPTK